MCLHISSLPGAGPIGNIGQDARRWIDFLAATGVRYWQFLPISPTGYGDSPYQPLSVFAGNPLFIDWPGLQQYGLLRSSRFDHEAPCAATHYPEAQRRCESLSRQVACEFFDRAGGELQQEFEAFRLRNRDWLHGYVQFRHLKLLHGERAWDEWAPEYRNREIAPLHRFVNHYRADLERIELEQFIFAWQWRQLREHAKRRQVALIGDAPIYLALDSADAWLHRELLQLDGDGRPTAVAGVPPDYFSSSGQLWGNPLYDWPYHSASGFDWWCARIAALARQVDYLRMDHFRGFVGYWSVPAGAETAREGCWREGPGDALFRALSARVGRLPLIAEDLGVITEDVRQLRERLGLPGMAVLQFLLADPEWDAARQGTDTICYTGTHDNDTSVGWYEDLSRAGREAAQRVSNRLARFGDSMHEPHWCILRCALDSPSCLAVAPMQDFLGLGSAARLNYPGRADGNWQWRLMEAQLTDRLGRRIAEELRQRGRA